MRVGFGTQFQDKSLAAIGTIDLSRFRDIQIDFWMPERPAAAVAGHLRFIYGDCFDRFHGVIRIPSMPGPYASPLIDPFQAQ